jgi:hypothetical protein
MPKTSPNKLAPPSGTETKHQKFLRLIQPRVTNVLEGLRLVGQLRSKPYENELIEAEEVVTVIAESLNQVAKLYAVPFSFKSGRAQHADPTNVIPIIGVAKPAPTTAEVVTQAMKVKGEIAKALDLLKTEIREDYDAARAILVELL